MKIISSTYYDVQKGNAKARKLEKKLIQEWEGKFERAAETAKSKREAEHTIAIRDWEDAKERIREQWKEGIDKDKNIRRVVRLSTITALIMFPAVFYYSLAFPSSPALNLVWKGLCWFFPVFGSFVVSGFIVYFILLNRVRNKQKHGPTLPPKPSPDPAPSLSKSNWFNLHDLWEVRLQTKDLHSADWNYGDVGENRLVEHLSYHLSDDYVCIKRLMVEDNLDADAVILGPSGIWVLESKYYSGTIRLRNSQWTRRKTYYAPGGVLTQKVDHFCDLEEQWLREKTAVENILRKNGLKTKSVQGGIAFSHPESTLDADSSSWAPFGDIHHWCEAIAIERDSIRLPQQQVLKILEVLLRHSSSLLGHDSISAVQLAEDMYEQKASRVAEFCNENTPANAYPPGGLEHQESS